MLDSALFSPQTSLSSQEIHQLQTEVAQLKQHISVIEAKLSIPGSLSTKETTTKEILLPVSIFCTSLSSLEVIVKYLKEGKNLRFSEIAKLLARNDRTIWHAFRRATQKGKVLQKVPTIPIVVDETLIDKEAITVPVSVFVQRKYAPLEILTAHLREHYQLSFSEIGRLLARNPKTVWTAYSRWRKKNVL